MIRKSKIFSLRHCYSLLLLDVDFPGVFMQIRFFKSPVNVSTCGQSFGCKNIAC